VKLFKVIPAGRYKTLNSFSKNMADHIPVDLSFTSKYSE